MNTRNLPYVTRVLVPQKRADILHRERLVDFLHERVDCRLILISAPPGYGKTTLLVDFVHSVQGTVCWYTLSEADKDPKVFLEYLVASIRQRFPGFGEKTLNLLDRVADVSTDISSMVGILVNEIHATIPDYLFLVLDDYHHVDDSPVVNEAVDLLLYYVPSNCHIILSSRSLPKLTLSRLAAQRLVAGIGTSDLRFTAQEIRDFLRMSFKVLLTESLAQELAESSEGWITGIVLGTYGLGQGMLETILRARNSRGPVFDFLANEVFGQQPAYLQTFLLETSILRQFNVQISGELLGISNSQEILLDVEERNLFISRSEGSDWYHYHNLFAEFLQNKFKEEHPDRYVALSTRAGAVFSERGEADEAIRHYARAGRFDKAIEIIENAGEMLLNTGKVKTMQRWLEVVPHDMVEANPQLMMFRGRVYQVGELDKALESFDGAIEGFEQQGDRRNAAKALAKKSTILRLMGSRQEAVDNWLKVLKMAEDDDEAQAEARKGIGIVQGMEGRFGESIPELERSLAIYERLGSTYQMAELYHALGMASYSKGDLSTALERYRQALSLWEKLGNPGFAADVLNNLAMVSYWQGDYEEALRILKDALTKVRESGYLRIEAHILGSLGTVLRDMDDFDEALRVYENGLDLARRVNEVLLITHLLSEIGGLYRLRGDFTRAERLIRQALSQALELNAPREIALYELSLGLLIFDRGNLRQAATQISKACLGLKSAGAQRELARAHYYLANVCLAQSHMGEAEKQLKVVAQIASALGYETFLRADVKRAPRPAEFAVTRNIGGDWPKRMLPLGRPAGSTQLEPSISAHEAIGGMPSESLPPVRVHSLGHATVMCGSREVAESDWSTQITKELFFYLISQSRGARREEIMEALWPELPGSRANSNFHVALHRLRRATYPELFIHQGGRYLLNPGVDMWYDAEEFERSVSQAQSCGVNSDGAIPHWKRAVSLFRGPFLAQFYSEWCEAKRRGLEERYTQALAALARYHYRIGDFEACIPYYEKVLAADPYEEEFHRELIKAYELSGDRPAAVRHYNRLVQMLREELGSGPMPETIAVYNSLLNETAEREANKKDKGQKNRSMDG